MKASGMAGPGLQGNGTGLGVSKGNKGGTALLSQAGQEESQQGFNACIRLHEVVGKRQTVLRFPLWGESGHGMQKGKTVPCLWKRMLCHGNS